MHEVKIFTVHKNLSSKKILFSFRVERYINIKEPLRQGEFIIVYNQNDEARIAHYVELWISFLAKTY